MQYGKQGSVRLTCLTCLFARNQPCTASWFWFVRPRELWFSGRLPFSTQPVARWKKNKCVSSCFLFLFFHLSRVLRKGVLTRAFGFLLVVVVVWVSKCLDCCAREGGSVGATLRCDRWDICGRFLLFFSHSFSNFELVRRRRETYLSRSLG